MRKWLWVTLVIAAFGLAGCGNEQWRDHQGEAVARTELQGNWVVVNYWAEWCAPCLHELPEFNRLAAARPDIRVFGVNYDGVSGEELRELSDRMGIAFPVMGQDFEESLKLERPQVLPTTYIFNPAGELVHSLPGPQTEASLMALLGQDQG